MELLIISGFVLVAFVIGLSRKKPNASPPPELRSAPRQSLASKPFNRNFSQRVTKTKIITGPAYVIDGDTIVIKKTQIRLFGVDAPEMNHPYGKNAKWALVKLCKGNSVKAEITDQDVHGRTVARCHLDDGRDLSAEMVKLGLAIDWPKYSGGIYRDHEVPDARKKMWLADARQKGRMKVWEKYEARRADKAK